MSPDDRLDGHDFDESLLSAYVDGELDASARAQVDARLEASAELRAVLDEVRGMRSAVRGLPPVDAPVGFWDAVCAGDTKVVAISRAPRRRSPATRWRALAGAAAAAVIVGVVLVPRPETVTPQLDTITQSHGERASLDGDAVSNLAGVVVSQDLAP
jgi:anti-sigma factor RsiW